MDDSHSSGWMILKIDLEKAYGRLRWDCILDSVQQASFSSKWGNLISKCLHACSMRVLWNGEALTDFKPTHGVRQGYPLSPYLFVLGMERLNHCIAQTIQEGGGILFPSLDGDRCCLTFSLSMTCC